ncbi:MAG: FliH/SctL family protein [Acidobacteria bacterium]|nr:FliH/SctL family protein [Acidobacteriota bacterium]
MSSKGQRITGGNVVPFDWGLRHASDPGNAPPSPPVPAPTSEGGDAQSRLAKLEREAFATAYAQGEKAGHEAGAKRADAMLRRMADTLKELEDLRQTIIRQTERQVVQLALSIAQRILRREVQVDQELTCAMARVALDRLGEVASIRIRLNPDDHAAITARHGPAWAGRNVTIEADPAINRGGCLIESPFGFIDASVEAQFKVIEQTLAADEPVEVRVVGPRAS